MSKKVSLTITLIIMLSMFVYSSVFAQEMEYKDYMVVKGDTLWDISAKEIGDPFLWPKIWKENPDIKNPDRIYPGQQVRIPLHLLKMVAEQKAVEEVEKKVDEAVVAPEPPKIEPVVEEPPKPVERKIIPIKKRYIVDKDTLISSGYITDYISPKIKSVGSIAGAPTGRTLFGINDYIYITTNSSSNKGDRFYIIRPVALIEHPKTKVKIGHLIEVLGIAQTIGNEDGKTKALITKSYNEIRKGDLLDTFYDMEPAIEDDTARTPDINALIIAARKMKTISGFLDIIFIDKGSNDGLMAGDMLRTVTVDKDNESRSVGTIQIINTMDSTATAIVKKSEYVISVGDEVRGLK